MSQQAATSQKEGPLAHVLPPLPYAPDAWYESEGVKTGYEISFTRYFYKPQPLRTLEEIRAEILAMEKGAQELLGEIFGKDAR